MSEQTPANQEPEISVEEAQAQWEEVQAKLERASGQARAMFSQNVKLAEERLTYAESQIAETNAVREQLLARKDEPEAAGHILSMDLLLAIYNATKTMMTIEKQSNEANLAILDLEELPEETPTFHVPANNPHYLEARSRIDYHMAYFLWLSNLEGIDYVMRAAVAQPAIVPQTEEEAAWRTQSTADLKAKMAGDRDLALVVGQWGNELQETQALLEWAASSFSTILKLAPEAKKGYLEDTDWAKLNAKVLFLTELADKAQAYPALAERFPVPEPSPLPYEQFVWTEEKPGTGRLGTGRLSGAGQPARGQTGRLSGSGQPGTGRLSK